MLKILKATSFGFLHSVFTWVYFEVMLKIAYSWPVFIEELVWIIGGPIVLMVITSVAFSSYVLIRTRYFNNTVRIIYFLFVSEICNLFIYNNMFHSVFGDTVFAVSIMLGAAIVSTAICTIVLFMTLKSQKALSAQSAREEGM